MPFKRNNVQSISDWFPILNWPRLPNFGHCHTNWKSEDFNNEYFVSDKLATLYKNICATMSSGGVNAANIRITGDPGAGKTSFLYALKRMSKTNSNILKDYLFYIFHINRVEDGEAAIHYSSEILHHIEKAWKLLFKESGKKDVYLRFFQQKLTSKDLINKLSEYYVDHKKEFSKILVFIIDDVDLLPGDHVATVADCILRNMEVASVKKWLVLRDIKYDNYRGETKQRIEQFFPDPYSFPSVSLFSVVEHRIRSLVNGNNHKKNDKLKVPFKSHICDSVVKPMCEGNMREGLSMLKSLLEENLPKGLDVNTSEEFIQNYIDKASINTLLSSHKLINLHANIFRVGIYPLAIDILGCASYHQSASIIFGSVSDCVIKRDGIKSRIIGNDEETVRLRKSDFDYVLERLEEHNLLNYEKKNNIIKLTEKGKMVSFFAVGDHYYDFCRSNVKNVELSNEYWALASRDIVHSEIVSTFLRWKHQREGRS